MVMAGASEKMEARTVALAEAVDLLRAVNDDDLPALRMVVERLARRDRG